MDSTEKNESTESPKKQELDESSVTMVDWLKETEEMEENAAAVLGGSNEKFCTYDEGYVKRQALYSCLTCIPKCKEDSSLAIAVCLACCNNCHSEHETIELYTKRNVRCDCGLKGSPQCTLRPKTGSINKDNTYNQNYSGVYCTCHRPYPDPEDTNMDEMIQCIICEDWYHGRHLKAYVPNSVDFSEMTCQNCVEKHDFLQNYVGLSYSKIITEKSVTEVDVEADPVASGSSEEPATKRQKIDTPENSTDGCKKPKKPENPSVEAMFWSENWRKQLCQCQDCIKIYEDQKVSFLTDVEDTVHCYEEKGKKAPKNSLEMGMQALSSLDHARQIEAIQGYNDMKNRLMTFLQSFVVNRTIVTEDDINRFFSGMNENKKKNLNVPPSSCR